LRTRFVWPWLLGAALRLYQLPTQALVEDEWHMVHRLRDGASFASLITDFGANDHSVALAACSWLMMRVTAVDELLLRLPSVAAGLALLVMIPVLIERLIGRETAIVLAWSLAVSPMLCFFSRLVRPYAITTLLTGVAVLSFHRWYEAPAEHRAARLGYLLSAATAPVFHLAALPAVLAPFALPALTSLAWLAPPSASASIRQVGRLFLVTVVAMALPLLIPLVLGGDTLVAKFRADHLALASLPGTLELLAGTGRASAVAIVAGLTLAGIVALGVRAPLLVLYLLTVAAIQILVVVAGGAVAVHVPIVLARYLVVVLPLLLIFPATALVRALRVRGDRLATGVGALVAGILLWIGPLVWIYEAPNDFTNHVAYQADYVPGRYFERFRPFEISTFYRDVLAVRAPGSVTIVEAPWHFYFHSLAYLQRIHRQHVVVGFVDERDHDVRDGELSATESRIRLRRGVRLDDREGLRARHVDFVVLHHDVLTETRWPTGVTELPIDMTRWVARYRSWFGEPVFDDPRIVVFAVS
jgi:hypothetical protein